MAFVHELFDTPSYVLQMFRKLHNAYVDMLCNPFYIPGVYFTDVQEVTQWV